MWFPKTVLKPMTFLLGSFLSLSSQAIDYHYDALNRLIQASYASGLSISYRYDAAGNLLSVTETRTCPIYALHDKHLNHTQFFTINPDQDFDIKLLGPLYPEHDIEALDIHPTTHQLYAASGDKASEYKGYLYHVDAHHGALTRIGDIGYDEINSLSFHPDGSLWGWADTFGLLQIDLITGMSTLIKVASHRIEDITWNNQGTHLYAIQGSGLLIYEAATQTISPSLCLLPHDDIEVLDTLPDGQLLFSTYASRVITLHTLDVDTCEDVEHIHLDSMVEGMNLNDIEGIAWSEDTCTR